MLPKDAATGNATLLIRWRSRGATDWATATRLCLRALATGVDALPLRPTGVAACTTFFDVEVACEVFRVSGVLDDLA